MNCFAAFISPITANIYFPALPAIAQDLDVSISDVNLSLTTYMIFQVSGLCDFVSISVFLSLCVPFDVSFDFVVAR